MVARITSRVSPFPASLGPNAARVPAPAWHPEQFAWKTCFPMDLLPGRVGGVTAVVGEAFVEGGAVVVVAVVEVVAAGVEAPSVPPDRRAHV